MRIHPRGRVFFFIIMVLVFGIYYLLKEKEDKESVKIYGVTTAIGAVIFVGMLISLIIKLM